MNSLPANACDCHMHAFDPKYAFAPGATPVPPASVPQYREVQARLGTTRTVVVAPSSYGLDNRCTLDALKALGPQARAVVALSTEVTREELDGLHAAGVRGVRLNLARGDSTPFDTLRPLAHRIEPLGWHVQLMLTPDQLVLHCAELLELGVRLVIDHMARIPQDGGVASPAYSALRRLVDTGNAWVKLSLASSAQLLGTAKEDALHTVGCDLVGACTGRLLWGSDWPHVLSTLEGQSQPSDERLLALFLEWATTEHDRQSILVDTPASLYDFPTSSL